MLSSVLFCVVVFVLSVWVTFRIANRHVLELCRAIPSAQPCYPILGNTLLFACALDKVAENVRRVFEETVLIGGKAVCFWISAYPIVFVTDPAGIKEILNNSLSRGKEIEESNAEYMKHGLLTAPVDHWKVTRRHLNLSFHPRNLEQLIPTFNSTSRQLVIDLSGHVDGAVFNLMPHVMSTALRTICIFLYGPKTVEFVSTEQFNNLKHAVELAAKLMALRTSKPWLYNGFVFKLLYWKEINDVKTIFLRMLLIADSHLDKRNILTSKAGGDLNGKHEQSHQYEFKTVLNAMRELQEKVLTLTDQHVLEEMVSFFATGTDTIGLAVSSCLLALARFPDIQNKVFEEICSVVTEEDDQDINGMDLKRLAYLDQVIKETLRFFSVVPFCTRAPTRDIELGGYTIPANKTTFLCISAACFDPKYFPDPYKFDPDRFSTPSSSDDVFTPFGRGPRNCIGKGYSMMFMRVMVVHVIRKYSLSTNMDIQNLKKTFMITLTCCDGYNVFLTKRMEK